MASASRTPSIFTRRQFLRTAAVGAAAVALPRVARAAGAPFLPIIGSAESFKFMSPSALARFAQVVGWTGMAASVRQGGHIEPEHVRDDLPEFFNGLQTRGLELPLVTTDITSMRQLSTEGVLRQTAKLGIKQICIGNWKLDPHRSLALQKRDFVIDLRDLGALCRELHLSPGFENAVDPAYFGTDVRDLLDVIGASGQNVGIFFNPARAYMVHGAVHEQAEIARPHLVGVFAEDFLAGSESAPKSCPLGNGIVPSSYFHDLRPSGFTGLVMQRFDYTLGNNESILAHARSDLATVQQWLGQYVASPFL